tara:strand:+ start:1000 stop:1617 length:618 start_codon:yes stop_codon:yes gene_type:complete
MKNLNNDVILQITTFCQLKEKHNILSTNKQNYNTIKPHLEKNIKEKKQYILTYFPDIIIDVMNNISTLIFAPILKYQEKFEGSTGYIDQIKVTDTPYPIMVGVTAEQRPFITFKLTNQKQKFVETLFQRFTNDKFAWTFGTYYHSALSNFNGYTTNMYNNKIQINDHLLKQNIKYLLENKGYIYKIIFKTRSYSGEKHKQPLLLC